MLFRFVCVLAVVACAYSEITVSPENYIGQRNGLYPQTFSGYQWKQNSVYNYSFFIEGTPKSYSCQISPKDSSLLSCNLGEDSINFQSNTVTTTLYEDGKSIYTGSAAVGDFSSRFVFVSYWPVSAPAQNSTIITINMTVDPSVRDNYEFDLTGDVSYLCVWRIDKAPLTWSNYASSYSKFTPTANYFGTCPTPVLGTISANPNRVRTLTNTPPLQSNLYVVGTDGFTSQYVPCLQCNSQTIQEFDFTTETFNQISTAKNNYLTDQVTPNQVNQFGQTVFTIQASNLITKVGTKSYVYYALVADPVSEESLGSRTPAECSVSSSSVLICPGPTAFTRRFEESYPQQVIIYGNRGDDSPDNNYRIAKFNISYSSAFVDNVMPQDKDGGVLVGPDSTVTYSTNSIFLPANYTCLLTQNYGQKILATIHATIATASTITCKMPHQVSGLSEGDSVGIYLVVLSVDGQQDIGVSSSALESATWTTEASSAGYRIGAISLAMLLFCLHF